MDFLESRPRFAWGHAASRTDPLAAAGGSCGISSSSSSWWGAASIPASYAYVNWMLHMSGYVLFGGIVGLAAGRIGWCGLQPVRLLWAGMVVIIVAANIVGLGMAS